MNAPAPLRAAQEPTTDRDVLVALTQENQDAMVATYLSMSVQLLLSADRLKGIGQHDKADAIGHDALVLSRAELSVPNAKR